MQNWSQIKEAVGLKRGQKRDRRGGKDTSERKAGLRTVDPADGQRLEDGQKQQAGSAAGEVVVDLEDVQTPLRRHGDKS